jgi:hypothetical protein
MGNFCPKCGSIPKRKSTKYGDRVYCCDLWAWGDAPLVDKGTHEARKIAHSAFDELWKSGEFTRKAAYSALAKGMGIPKDQCHIKQMDKDQALKVPWLALKIRYSEEIPL